MNKQPEQPGSIRFQQVIGILMIVGSCLGAVVSSVVILFNILFLINRPVVYEKWNMVEPLITFVVILGICIICFITSIYLIRHDVSKKTKNKI